MSVFFILEMHFAGSGGCLRITRQQNNELRLCVRTLGRGHGFVRAGVLGLWMLAKMSLGNRGQAGFGGFALNVGRFQTLLFLHIPKLNTHIRLTYVIPSLYVRHTFVHLRAFKHHNYSAPKCFFDFSMGEMHFPPPHNSATIATQ